MKLLLSMLFVCCLSGCARGYIAGHEPLECSYIGTNTYCNTNESFVDTKGGTFHRSGSSRALSPFGIQH